MKLNILLTTSPENLNRETVIKLATATIETGHSVNLFLMDDGVYNVVLGNSVSPSFLEIMTKGVSISLCAHTAQERGVKKEDCLCNVNFAGQYELSCMVNEADRFLMF